MDITINLSDIQVGKKYTLEFCLYEDGKKVIKKSTPASNKIQSGPCIDDIEKNTAPRIEDVKSEASKKGTSDFKIESSFGDNKIDTVK